jgi:hypothetical protein
MEQLAEIKSVLRTHLVEAPGSQTPGHHVSFSESPDVRPISPRGGKRVREEPKSGSDSVGPKPKRLKVKAPSFTSSKEQIETTSDPQPDDSEAVADPFEGGSDSEEGDAPSANAPAVSEEVKRFLRPVLFKHYRDLEFDRVKKSLPSPNFVFKESDMVNDALMEYFRHEFPTIPVDSRLPPKFKGKSGKNFSRLKLKYMVLTTVHGTTKLSNGEPCPLDSYSVLQRLHNRQSLTRISNIPETWKKMLREANIPPPTKKNATVGLCHLCDTYKSNQTSVLRHIRKDHYSFGFMCALCGMMANDPDDLFPVTCPKIYESPRDFLAKHKFVSEDLGGYKLTKKYFPKE